MVLSMLTLGDLFNTRAGSLTFKIPGWARETRIPRGVGVGQEKNLYRLLCGVSDCRSEELV